MSVGVLQSTDLVNAAVTATVERVEHDPIQTVRKASGWTPENFAREQIRGLVRQLFFASVARPVRQVVFWAAEARTDIQRVCLQVAESLALETTGSVAMVSHAVDGDRPVFTASQAESEENVPTADADATPARQFSIRIRKNLWLVPQLRLVQGSGVLNSPLSACLTTLRRDFEYSIVQGPPAGESSEAAALGQSADGIVLVLAAHVTRRAIALKIKATLEAAQVRVLGTVLSERRFPIPEAIYRRL